MLSSERRHEATEVATSRFTIAPPRHFLYPAIILLLSEQPGYGYSLVKDLQEFNFGHIDRPSVYRALAQLETDGLVESWSETPVARQTRRVYGLTAHGERVLRIWMGVIKQERDCLDYVLRRYQATDTTEAALAEVEGTWSAFLGQSWSAVSSTSPSYRRRKAGHAVDWPAGQSAPSWEGEADGGPIGEIATDTGSASAGDGSIARFRVVPERSVVLIEARSTVGPISFGTIGMTGLVEADIRGGSVGTSTKPVAHLKTAVAGLRSGNSLYDAELLRRIEARRFPVVSIDLRDCTRVGPGNRYLLAGEITFHGVTRPVQGTVTVTAPSDRMLVVAGEQVFDMRDFDIASPTVLMLRIFPDVRVHVHVEAERED
jgi:DNA-binding PadR family transcriptional regulator